MKKEYKSYLILLVTAIIWGSAFVAQSAGMEYVGPFTFNAIRFTLGGIFLLPVIFIKDAIAKKRTQDADAADMTEARSPVGDRKSFIKAAVICSLALFVSSSLQQVGIQYTTAGKAGFLTALYIVLVPIIGIIFGKKPGISVIFGVLLAVVGLYLLTVNEKMTVNPYDFLLIGCAVGFSVHIIAVDRYSPYIDGVRLSCTQFFVSGILSAIPMFIYEKPSIGDITDCAVPILYAGIMSCGVAYTLQIIGQKHANPTTASIIMSLESVFAVITGWIILGDTLSLKEAMGCILMFAAIIFAQTDIRKLILNLKNKKSNI